MSEPLWHPGKIVPADQGRKLPRWELGALSGPLPGDPVRKPQSEAERRAIAEAEEARIRADMERQAAAARAAAQAIEAAQKAAAPPPPPPPPPPAVDPAEVERIKKAAFDEGYAAGYDHGAQAARKEAEQLQTLAAGAFSMFDRFESDIAPRLIDMALEIARQVTRHELQAADPAVAIGVVRDAFQQLTGTETGKHLMLNPADALLVRAHLGDELALGHWKIIEDASMTPGGCKISTQQSEIDATVQTRWKRTLAALGLESVWEDKA
jgi:flagellar assembly protein FliH